MVKPTSSKIPLLNKTNYNLSILFSNFKFINLVFEDQLANFLIFQGTETCFKICLVDVKNLFNEKCIFDKI